MSAEERTLTISIPRRINIISEWARLMMKEIKLWWILSLKLPASSWVVVDGTLCRVASSLREGVLGASSASPPSDQRQSYLLRQSLSKFPYYSNVLVVFWISERAATNLPRIAQSILLARREHLIFCDEWNPSLLLFTSIGWTLQCSTSERKRASSYEWNFSGNQRDAIRKRIVKEAERKVNIGKVTRS